MVEIINLNKLMTFSAVLYLNYFKFNKKNCYEKY